MGNEGGCWHILEKRLLTLFLGFSKSGKFHIGVKSEAVVDALWICISLLCNIILLCGVIYHILREASALLVLLQWAFQSLEKRDEQQVRLSRFFCLILNHYPRADSVNFILWKRFLNLNLFFYFFWLELLFYLCLAVRMMSQK